MLRVTWPVLAWPGLPLHALRMLSVHAAPVCPPACASCRWGLPSRRGRKARRARSCGSALLSSLGPALSMLCPALLRCAAADQGVTIHDSLEASMAFVLSNKLASSTLTPAHLIRLITTAYEVCAAAGGASGLTCG